MNLLALPFFPGSGPERLLTALGRGSLEVTFLACLVWLACRALPRIPGRMRFWLWWLCCVKGLTAVVAQLSGAALPLPIALPAMSAPRLLPVPTAPVAPAPKLVAESQLPDLLDTDDDALDISSTPPAPVEPTPAPLTTVPMLCALGTLFYGSGVAVVLLATLAQGGRAFALRRRAEPCTDQTVLDAAQAAAAASKLRTSPAVAVSDLTRSPLVIGILRPMLILPRDFAASLPSDSLRLALLHEMAHIRRGDLLLAWIPQVLRAVFFFLPPVYLIFREVEQAREEACDASALSTANCGSAEYGRLLLTVSQQAGRGGLVRLGGMPMAAVPFRHLKRRLLAVQGAGRPVPRGVRAVASLLVGVMGALSLPWQGLERAAEANPLPLAVDTLDDKLPRYEIIPLGDLGEHYSGTYSDALAISDNGQIAGSASLRDGSGRGHAYRLQTNQKQVVDPSAGSEFGRSHAVGINDAGLMVVSAFNRWSRPRAFVWDGQRRYLETVRGYRYSEAAGINDDGQVAATATRGRRVNGALPTRAYIWRNGRVRLLATLGGPFSRAHAINDAGWVAGKADLPRAVGEIGVTHACVWDTTGQAHDLGTLTGGYNSAARAVSLSGTVVGFSEVEGGVHAFRADTEKAGTVQDLGVLPGYDHSTAWGVADTDRGEVIVGSVMANRDGGDSRAVVWQGRTGIDLNRCIAPNTGWTLEVARAINARGEIVGQGRIDGREQAFLLRPAAQ